MRGWIKTSNDSCIPTAILCNQQRCDISGKVQDCLRVYRYNKCKYMGWVELARGDSQWLDIKYTILITCLQYSLGFPRILSSTWKRMHSKLQEATIKLQGCTRYQKLMIYLNFPVVIRLVGMNLVDKSRSTKGMFSQNTLLTLELIFHLFFGNHLEPGIKIKKEIYCIWYIIPFWTKC